MNGIFHNPSGKWLVAQKDNKAILSYWPLGENDFLFKKGDNKIFSVLNSLVRRHDFSIKTVDVNSEGETTLRRAFRG